MGRNAQRAVIKKFTASYFLLGENGQGVSIPAPLNLNASSKDEIIENVDRFVKNPTSFGATGQKIADEMDKAGLSYEERIEALRVIAGASLTAEMMGPDKSDNAIDIGDDEMIIGDDDSSVGSKESEEKEFDLEEEFEKSSEGEPEEDEEKEFDIEEEFELQKNGGGQVEENNGLSRTYTIVDDFRYEVGAGNVKSNIPEYKNIIVSGDGVAKFVTLDTEYFKSAMEVSEGDLEKYFADCKNSQDLRDKIIGDKETYLKMTTAARLQGFRYNAVANGNDHRLEQEMMHHSVFGDLGIIDEILPNSVHPRGVDVAEIAKAEQDRVNAIRDPMERLKSQLALSSGYPRLAEGRTFDEAMSEINGKMKVATPKTLPRFTKMMDAFADFRASAPKPRPFWHIFIHPIAYFQDSAKRADIERVSSAVKNTITSNFKDYFTSEDTLKFFSDDKKERQTAIDAIKAQIDERRIQFDGILADYPDKENPYRGDYETDIQQINIPEADEKNMNNMERLLQHQDSNLIMRDEPEGPQQNI